MKPKRNILKKPIGPAQSGAGPAGGALTAYQRKWIAFYRDVMPGTIQFEKKVIAQLKRYEAEEAGQIALFT